MSNADGDSGRGVGFLWFLLAAGAAPVIVATVLLTTWAVTRWSSLVDLGFSLLVVAIPLNLLALIVSFVMWRRVPASARPRLRRRWLVADIILWLNYPIAFVFFLFGSHIASRVEVTLINDSDSPVEATVIDPAQNRVVLGRVYGKDRVSRSFSPRGEGPVSLRIEHGATASEVVLIGYVTLDFSGERNRVTAVVSSEGEISVVSANQADSR